MAEDGLLVPGKEGLLVVREMGAWVFCHSFEEFIASASRALSDFQVEDWNHLYSVDPGSVVAWKFGGSMVMQAKRIGLGVWFRVLSARERQSVAQSAEP